MDLPPERWKAVEVALAGCLNCHSLQPSINVSAPTLKGVYGRSVATTPFTGYSQALKGVGGVWDRKQLERFLTSPADFAPGTIMPNQQLVPQTRTDIIQLLEALNAPE